MSKFHIKKSSAGYSFVLKAQNGKNILKSQVYKAEKSSVKGIESIQINAAKAKFDDETVPSEDRVTNPKFVVFLDSAGEYRFHIRARNGEIIAQSEGYIAKENCLKGIESVRKNAAGAIIVREW